MTIHDIHRSLVDQVHGETNRDHRKLANNTYARIEWHPAFGEISVIVRLHDTDIIVTTPDALMLNTGGWFTVTTKERLHRYTPGLSIHSVKGVWFVSTQAVWDYDDPNTYTNYHQITPGRTLSRFFDGMVLRDGPTGIAVDDAVMDDPDIDLRKALERYVKSYTDDEITRLVTEARESGSNGDCMFCQFGGGARNPVGGDHLLLHVAEDYRMVTLLVNAVKEAGYRPEIYLGGWNDQWRMGDTIRRAVRKMLKAALLNKGLKLPTAEELELV